MNNFLRHELNLAPDQFAKRENNIFQTVLIVASAICQLMQIISLVIRVANVKTAENRATVERHNEAIRDHFRRFDGRYHTSMDEFDLVLEDDTEDEHTRAGAVIGGVGVGFIAVTIAIGVWFYDVILKTERWIVAKNEYASETRHGSFRFVIWYHISLIFRQISCGAEDVGGRSIEPRNGGNPAIAESSAHQNGREQGSDDECVVKEWEEKNVQMFLFYVFYVVDHYKVSQM